MKILQLDLIISAAYQSTTNSGNEKMQFAKSQLSYQQHKTQKHTITEVIKILHAKSLLKHLLLILSYKLTSWLIPNL